MYITKTATAIIAVLLMTTTAWTFGGGAGGGGFGVGNEFLVPEPPRSVTATPCNGEATVSFTPPKREGIKPITDYTIISHPSRIRVSGKQSPITVGGLTNGRVYNFTVTATNSIGTGLESEPSNSVTPQADRGLCESQSEMRTQQVQ